MSDNDDSNSRPASRARITIVEQVSYQSDTGGTLALADRAFSHDLLTDEQPYQRILTIGEKAQKLDMAWLDSGGCYMLRVENRPPQRTTYPTAVEAADARDAVVELSVDLVPFTTVPVGASVRVYPTATYQVRCLRGKATIIVTAVPK